MALGTLGSTLNDELNRLANGGTYRDMNQMVDEALAAKQWANRENINPYSTDTVGILNEIAGLGLDKKNWLDFNGVCNYIAGTTGLPAAAALRQVYPTTDLLTGVASYYVDATAPTNWGSLGYVYFPYSTTSYLSVPDSSSLDITGDIDIRVRTSMDDWTPSVQGGFIFKDNTTGNQRSWQFRILTTGILYFGWTTDGSTFLTAQSTVATGITDGAVKWIRVTMDVDNGASGRDIKFWTSDDNITWTQLGTTVTQAGTTSIYSGSAAVEIGAAPSPGLGYAGNFYQAQVYASLNGTDKRLDVNIATDWKASELASFTATTGGTVYPVGIGTISNLGTAGSLLPTTMGSSYSTDSNDPKFLDFTGTNYVYVPGVNGNNISVPDSAALDITGDIDIRVQMTMDDWTPSALAYAISKFTGTVNSYSIFVNTDGTLNLNFSVNGSTGVTATSVATGVADGSVKWIRATRTSSTGVVKFFLSDDGTTWTQLGTDVSSTSGSLFVSTANVTIGSRTDTAATLAGKVFRAQILDGIDGTTVLDVDTSTLKSGQDSYIIPTTYTGAAGAYFTGTGLSINGTGTNYASTTDSSVLDVTGDIDLRAKVALTDWTPSEAKAIIVKRDSSSTRSYIFTVGTTGTLELGISTTGSNQINYASSVEVSVADGAVKWIRATRVASTGNTQFFTSDDGVSWTQLGTDVSGTSGNIFNSTSSLVIGSIGLSGANVFDGTFYRAQVFNGIDGTKVFDANFEGVPADSLRVTDTANNAVVSLVTTRYCAINRSTSGRKTVAVTQPTWLFGTDDYMEVNNRYMSSGTYLYLPGVAGNYASTPDAAALDITGDLDLRVKVALDDWTAINQLLNKWVSGSNQRSYRFYVQADGKFVFSNSTDGLAGTVTNYTSSVAPTVTDGSTLWARVTIDVDNGAAGRDVKFFTSTDGTNWTQLGTTVTTAGVTSIFSGSGVLEVGSQDAGSNNPARGKFFRAQVLNGIDGTVAFDANFETSITSLLQTSFTESSANAATVTINRSGSAYRSAGITTAGYLYPGATNTFTASATDFLNFGAADSFTLMAIARRWGTQTGNNYVIIGKCTSLGGTQPNYRMQFLNGTLTYDARIADGTNSASLQSSPATITSGQFLSAATSVNRDTQLLSLYKNNSLNSSITAASVGNLTTIQPFRIAAFSDSGSFTDMELYAAAVFRQALTATQIRQISNYFANREVYL